MSDRIADALERIADALERAHAAYMDIEASNQPAKPCDDRTCTERDHWAPMGRISHGSTPTTCVHGQDHPDALECEYHDEPLQVGEFLVSSLETGEPVPVHVVVTNRQTGATLFDGDLAKLPADLDLPKGGGWSADDLVQPMADPLDESDKRPRIDSDGDRVEWDECVWRCNGVGPDSATLAEYAEKYARIVGWADQ